MEDLIDVQTVITPQVFREMVYFQTFRKKRTTLPFGIVSGIIAIFNIVGRIFGLYNPGDMLFYVSLGYFLLIIGVLVVIEYQMWSFIRSDKTSVGHSHRMTVGLKGISSTADKNFSEFTWKNLHMVHETKSIFLFYINTSQAMVLQKSLITDTQHTELQKLVASKMGAKYIVH